MLVLDPLQECHEELRRLSQEAGDAVKLRGSDNDLIKRIENSRYFALIGDQLQQLVDPTSFVGRAPQQVSSINIYNFF